MAMLKRLLPVVILLLAGLGCADRSLSSQTVAAPAAASSVLHGDAAHPASTTGWVDTRLYFGLGPADAPDKGVTEAAWSVFLDQEITPRFPSGLSVVDCYGQWLSQRTHKVERLRSKMLLIDYPATAQNSARVEAIRAAWKQRTGDRSVLRVTQPADVSF
jgi:hypothetical protein